MNGPKSNILQSILSGPENSKKNDSSERTFEMRPDISKWFKSNATKEIIGRVLHDHLHEKTYSLEESEELTKTIAKDVRTQLEGRVYEKYKLVVNVVLGEMKGEGVKIGSRCLWDPETDSYATDSFMNETLFCVVTVYGILYY